MRRMGSLGCLIVAVGALSFAMPHASEAQSERRADVLAFHGGNDEQLQENFEIFDTDKNGAVDRTEFRLQRGRMFFVRDKNKDMYLAADELPNAEPKVFADADRDKDGRLTPHEYGESVFMKFETYDLDKDGRISLEEVRTVVKESRR